MNSKKIELAINKILKNIDPEDIQYLSGFYSKLDNLKKNLSQEELVEYDILLQDLINKKIEGKKKQLFPNKIPKSYFGIPSSFSDAFVNIVNSINKNPLSLNNKNYFLDKKKFIISFDKYQLSYKVNEEIFELPDEGVENIFDIINLVTTDGVGLQYFCALWNFAMIQNSFFFNYVKIDDILETFFTKPKNGYFRQSTRQVFTRFIKIFENIQFRLPVKFISAKNKTEFINIPLLDFSNSTENKKGDVKLRLFGHLLGGTEMNKRGRLFPSAIFKLDANKENKRIFFLFKIATRFDQLNQKKISWTLSQAIEYAGLYKTFMLNKKRATTLLENTLNEFIKIDAIKNYRIESDRVIVFSYLIEETPLLDEAN